MYLFLLDLVSGDGPTSSGNGAVCASKASPAAAGSGIDCVSKFEAGSAASSVEGKRRLSLVTPRRRESVLIVTNNEELEAEGSCEMDG